MGISETLVATSAAGIIFSLLAGQPLVIVGTTGPLLLFDESLFGVSFFFFFDKRRNNFFFSSVKQMESIS